MTKEQTKSFVLAGNVTFTLYSSKIDKRYTYKIKRDRSMNNRYLVRVLFGPDNENDYRYIGIFYSDTMNLAKTNETIRGKAFTMLRYFLKIVNGDYDWPETCKFYPSDRCGRCGRKLTTPESIERGIGPKCWSNMLEIGGA